ncbi:helix-turn-helix domain-containing protein [Sporosarcina aquimarina]|uniref:helix-turn-helix domain-containing protein n=1 Tax=Sporosarcina aquimarina TaxID=114975 RepID=UPI001C8EB7E9|nr:helix-turn-helix domain-containing protein [Sporosarcina aquimarina]MBY0221775.1 DNA-binding protein [Sporosarcina aquimarina]
MSIKNTLIIEQAERIEEFIENAIHRALHSSKPDLPTREWMSLADGAKYAGVSHNTFRKFRVLGLKVSQVDGVQRVSRKEIDKFLESNSY